MNRLSPDAAERIRTNAQAVLDGAEEPNPVADALADMFLEVCGDLDAEQDRNANLMEFLAFYGDEILHLRMWVSWLERLCRVNGIDPTDMGGA